MCACVRACVRVCMRACVRARVCVRACVRVCACVCVCARAKSFPALTMTNDGETEQNVSRHCDDVMPDKWRKTRAVYTWSRHGQYDS